MPEPEMPEPGRPSEAPVRPSAVLRRAAGILADAGVPSPRTDAELLLAHVLGVDRAELRRLAVIDAPLPDAGVAEAYERLVSRRAAREPVQHLTGVAPFRHLELAVGPGVFVPRPETEQVAQVAIDEAAAVVAARGSAVVVDLCTGTGAIALAVATEVPGSQVHAVELDGAAYEWAERNVSAVGALVAHSGVRNVATSAPAGLVRLVRGDARRAFADLDRTVDVVVSNPPYVPPDAVPRDPEVARHDPAVALYGLGPDGLEVPRGVTAAAARLLRPGGLYVMEHAEVQAEAARAMVEATTAPGTTATASVRAFEAVVTLPDLTGRPRMVVARRRDPARPTSTTVTD